VGAWQPWSAIDPSIDVAASTRHDMHLHAFSTAGLIRFDKSRTVSQRKFKSGDITNAPGIGTDRAIEATRLSYLLNSQ
jgi:hypothetical protein